MLMTIRNALQIGQTSAYYGNAPPVQAEAMAGG